MHTYIQTDGHTDTQTHRPTDLQTYIQTDKPTNKHTYINTRTHTSSTLQREHDWHPRTCPGGAAGLREAENIC